MLIYSESNVDANSALNKIDPYILKTPIEECKELSKFSRARVFVKMENWQKTGSFKVRGALNRIMSLNEEEKANGVITASAGNHGLGVAYASDLLDIRARIVLPVSAAPTKVQMLHNYNVDVIQAGRDYDESEDVAHRIEQDCGLTFVHAFEDPAIISGQGTVAIEMLEKIPDTDMIIVPVGGGGLISGIAITARQINPKIKIIGVQSEASPAMYRAIKANQAIESPIENTIADGLAGRLVSPNILSTIKHYVDDIILVKEKDIVSAILFLLKHSHLLVEGAAAAGFAAILAGKIRIENTKCIILLSGRNIDVDTVKSVLEHD